MTLEEELRIYDLYWCQTHHHKSVEGLHALRMMRDDIIGRYFKGSPEPLKEFGLAYMQYQVDSFRNINETMAVYKNE